MSLNYLAIEAAPSPTVSPPPPATPLHPGPYKSPHPRTPGASHPSPSSPLLLSHAGAHPHRAPLHRLDARPLRRRPPSGEAQNEFPASHSSSSTPWLAPFDTGRAEGRAPMSSMPPSMAGPPWTEAGRGPRLVDRVHGFVFSKIIP
jgi:hypothetical protein